MSNVTLHVVRHESLRLAVWDLQLLEQFGEMLFAHDVFVCNREALNLDRFHPSRWP